MSPNTTIIKQTESQNEVIVAVYELSRISEQKF